MPERSTFDGRPHGKPASQRCAECGTETLIHKDGCTFQRWCSACGATPDGPNDGDGTCTTASTHRWQYAPFGVMENAPEPPASGEACLGGDHSDCARCADCERPHHGFGNTFDHPFAFIPATPAETGGRVAHEHDPEPDDIHEKSVVTGYTAVGGRGMPIRFCECGMHALHQGGEWRWVGTSDVAPATATGDEGAMPDHWNDSNPVNWPEEATEKVVEQAATIVTLREYVQHKDTCGCLISDFRYRTDCTCGLSAALAGDAARKEGEGA